MILVRKPVGVGKNRVLTAKPRGARVHKVNKRPHASGKVDCQNVASLAGRTDHHAVHKILKPYFLADLKINAACVGRYVGKRRLGDKHFFVFARVPVPDKLKRHKACHYFRKRGRGADFVGVLFKKPRARIRVNKQYGGGLDVGLRQIRVYCRLCMRRPYCQ
jgi:hypothetical protein